MELAEGGMLAGLIRQAEEEGADLVTLRALVEEASELGAGRALKRAGLGENEEVVEFERHWRAAFSTGARGRCR